MQVNILALEQMSFVSTHGSLILGRDFHICGAHQAMTHPFQDRQEQLFHRRMPLFSESTKNFFCENSGFSLDFTLPKIGGE